MALSRALINKLKRRRKKLNRNSGSRRQDKIDRQDEVMAKSPGAYRLMREVGRKLESNLGQGYLQRKTDLEKLVIINDLDRHDFGSSDFGLRLRVDATAGVAEITHVTTLADAGRFERFTLTAPSFAASAQGDYFVFTDQAGATWAAWLDKDANGTAPTGAAYTAATNKIKVSIVTGNTATQVGTAVKAALSAVTDPGITDNLDGTLTFLYSQLGNKPDPARHNTGDTGNGSFAITINQQGAASSLNSTYFLLNSPTYSYYVWMNVNSTGTDPMVNNSTGIMVTLAGGDSANAVATAVSSAVDSTAPFTSSPSTNVVTITDASTGAAIDASDSVAAPTGFTVAAFTQGVTAVDSSLLVDAGIQEGDVVTILTGDLAGREYSVVDVVDDNTVRLEDDSDLSGPDTEVPVKIRLAPNKTSYN